MTSARRPPRLLNDGEHTARSLGTGTPYCRRCHWSLQLLHPLDDPQDFLLTGNTPQEVSVQEHHTADDVRLTWMMLYVHVTPTISSTGNTPTETEVQVNTYNNVKVLSCMIV